MHILLARITTAKMIGERNISFNILEKLNMTSLLRLPIINILDKL